MGFFIAPHRAQVCIYLECPPPLHMHQFLQEPLFLLILIIAFLYVPEHLPLKLFDSENKMCCLMDSFMFTLLP